jgi:hypothetical protein
MIIVAIVEFGRAMMVLETLTHISREGARRGALSWTSTATIEAHVQSLLTGSDLPIDDAQIDVYVNNSETEAANAVSGDQIRVKVTLPYSSISWLPFTGMLSSTNLAGAATMRREGY